MAEFLAKWDQTGERFYEIGVDRGMFYPLKNTAASGQPEKYEYVDGEAWSGLSKVTDKHEGADVNDIWADNMKYLSLRAAEKFGATIECYTYPNGFKACNGEVELVPGVTAGMQTRQAFGFSYRSRIGNDVKFQDYGYKIHLVYNATASPTEKSYGTINDSTDVDAMSFDVETTSIPIGTINNVEYKPTSYLEIDSTKVDPAKLAAFEFILYGTEGGSNPKMPLPSEVIEYFGGSVIPFVELDTHYLALTVGDTHTFTVNKNPADATVVFSTGSAAIADVGASTGTVSAESAGSTTITATYTDSDSIPYTDTCTVVVTAAANG